MSLLIRQELTAGNHTDVRRFSCGNAGPWCKYVDAWIKAAPESGMGAFRSMGRFGTSVWLYYDDITNELVAFGSLGANEIGWPTPQGTRVRAAYIPMLGIDERFHGLPNEPHTPKYCHQLVQDLLLEAQDTLLSRLLLHVSPDNHKAIGLYTHYGFMILDGYDDARGNKVMMKRLQ